MVCVCLVSVHMCALVGVYELTYKIMVYNVISVSVSRERGVCVDKLS